MIGHLSPGDCDRLIKLSAAHRPLIMAMRDYGLRLVPVTRGKPVAGLKDIGPNPWLAIVGDDLDRSHGPGAFDTKAARRLARAAKGIMVYSGPAEYRIYATACAAALMAGSIFMIETQIPHHAAWYDAVHAWAPNVPYLDISPIEGRA